ncbi:hypothetical protein F0562_018984 [Nyssa sinensis]|uniref:Protein kinase domain-containing protein n=1 Tax=Nyssa sinensis TaxID=561372 RepID=A0A5J4ZA06_9ASTE|nr:hypothetical protein F0562_018984 [Nyssa sinensis]
MDQGNLEELTLFNFEKLAIATDNFLSANKLGQGGFGPVYKMGDVKSALSDHPKAKFSIRAVLDHFKIKRSTPEDKPSSTINTDDSAAAACRQENALRLLNWISQDLVDVHEASKKLREHEDLVNDQIEKAETELNCLKGAFEAATESSVEYAAQTRQASLS